MKSVISVFLDDSDFGKSALNNSQILGTIFDAEVNPISLQKKRDLKTVFSEADEGNTLCFVMPVGRSKKLTFFTTQKARKWIRRSRVPVFTIGNIEHEINDYQQIVLPLDVNCQEKELALWASYFPTHFQKNCPHISKDNILIHIIFNQYKEKLLRQKVQNNIDFAKKMFDNLEVPYQIYPFTKVDNIHIFGLQFAKKLKNSVLLYLMPEHNSLIDLIFGPVSNRLLGNKEQISVLFLNEREDTLVLCQ